MRPLAPLPSYRVLSALARRMAKRVALTILFTSATLAPAHAAQWMDVATISSTLGNNAGRLCIGGGRTDLGCTADAPLLDRAAGLLTVPGDLRVIGNLYVSGSQQFDGVTFTNGGISSTGTISATNISINGQPVNAGIHDRIVSTSANVIVGTDGLVRFSTGGVTNTAYLDTSGRLVNSGVSTTGPISGTSGYFTNRVGVGKDGTYKVYLEDQGTTQILQSTNYMRIFSNGYENMYLRGNGGVNFSYGASFGGAYYGQDIPAGNLAVEKQVGIGTTTPTTALHVSGTLRIANGGEACDTSRLGAIRYTSSSFDICRNTTNGWEPLATATSTSTISINTGISGSLVYRNEYGVLMASNSLSISSTTGSVGIGAGAPASIGNNGLYAAGGIKSGSFVDTPIVYLGNATGLYWGGNSSNSIIGDVTTAAQQYLKFTTAGNEALRIVSTGLVGIGTSSPVATLTVSGTGSFTKPVTSGISAPAWMGSGFAGTYVYGSSGVLTANGNKFSWGSSETSFDGAGGPGGSQYIRATVNSTPVMLMASYGVAVGGNGFTPSTTLDVSGSIRLGAETSSTLASCDASRIGAIKYTSGAFYICQNTSNGWESLATTGANSLADRITSNSQAGVIANSTGYISLTTGGVTGTVYFTPAGKLVNAGVSTTGPVSATSVYAGNIGTNRSIVYRDANGVLSGNTGLIYNTSGTVAVGTGAPSWLVNGVWSEGYFATNTFFNLQNYSMESGVLWGSGEVGLYGGMNGSNKYMKFAVSNTEAMRIVSTGYVGIGTASPTATLHVSGTAIIGSPANYLQFAGGGIDRINSNLYIQTNGLAGNTVWMGGTGTRFGINMTNTPPSTTLDISGTIKISNGGETCDTNRVGAIKYSNNAFYICQNTSNGWESLATTGANSLADRITSNSQAGVIANSTGYISLTTGGVTGTAYFTPGGVYVGGGVSTTGPISGTSGYFGNAVVNSGALGTTLNATTQMLRLQYSNSNSSYLDTFGVRDSAGTDWWTAGTRTQQKIDGVYMGWMQYNGTNNKYGIAFGTGQGSNPLGVSESMRITSTGLVGIGTIAPSSTLHIMGVSNTAGGLTIGSSETGTTRFAIFPTGSTSAAIKLPAGGGLSFYGGGSNAFANFNPLYGTVFSNGYNGDVASSPASTTLQIQGSIRLGTESSTTLATCDANRLGAIKYQSSTFQICQTAANGWEPLATATSSSTPAISTGLSGSIVYRDQNGYLIANNTFSISSTTGSIGIGAGAPANVGNDGLFVSGSTTIGAAINAGGSFQFNTTAARYISWNGSGGAYMLGDPVAKYLLIGTSNTEAMRIVSTGYVGIGTSTPSAMLHVSGSAIINGLPIQYSGAADPSSSIGTNSFGSLFLNAGVGKGINFTQGGYNSTFYRMTLDAGGKLGISVTTPSATLHVNGTIRIADGGEACDVNRIGAMKYTGGDFYVCRNGTAWESLTSVANAAAALADRITSGTTQAIAYQDSSLSLVTSGTEQVVIGKNGNVGIGSQPNTSNKLYVAGSTMIGGNLNINSTVTQGMFWYNGNLSLVGNYTNQYLAFNTSNNEALRIVSSSRIGIGTIDPSSTLHVSGTITVNMPSAAAGGLLVKNGGMITALTHNQLYSTNTPLYLNLSSAQNIVLAAGGGNVGIGGTSANPSTTLHVSGTLRIADGGEACDTNRVGAIKYTANEFYICRNGTTWESFTSIATGAAALADRITSNSQAGVTANATGYISLTTGGITGTVYFKPSGVLVNAGISTTGTISGTNGYIASRLGIGTGSPSATLHIINPNLYENGIIVTTNSGSPLNLFSDGNNGITFGGADGQFQTGLQTSGRSLMMSVRSGGSLSPRVYADETGVSIFNTAPTVALTVSGTIQVADGGQSCDASRLGAIKYSANNFYVCRNGSSWETMSASGASSGNPDRIISGTAAVYTNQSGSSISLTTSSIERMIINASGYVGINQQPTNGVYLAVSGTTSITGRLGLSTPSTFNVIAGSFAGSALTGTYNAVFGYTAGQNNTGSNNILIGTYAGQNNTGSNAVAIGYASGLGNTGSSTVLVGNVAGQNNTGAFTTSIGNAAGQYNTGTNLTAVGASTAQSNTGINVSAFGFSAAQYNTGAYVTAIGQSSAYSNTGLNLTAVGYNSAYNNTAANTTSIGTNSMLYHTSGANNVALGINAGLGVNAASTYADSTLLGSYAGQALTSGNSNTLVGYNAGGGITTGSNNLVIGTNLSPYSNTGSNQLNIAGAIFGDTGRALASKIGINVTSPTANLEVSGTVSATRFVGDGSGLTNLSVNGDRIVSATSGVYVSSTGVISLAISGSSVGYINTRGLTTTGVSTTGTISATSFYTPGDVHAEDGNVYAFRFWGDSLWLNNQGTIHWANNTYLIGDGLDKYITLGTNDVDRLTIVSTGLVGISTTAPSTTLDVRGTLRIANGGETCDANRTGAIRYTGGAFSICQTAANGWEPLATGGISSTQDRITSGTTQMIVYNNASATIATAGTQRIIVGTNGNVGIASQPLTGYGLTVSGSAAYKGSFIISTTDNSVPAFYVSGTTGAIGLRTNNPGAVLDVRGGNVYVGNGDNIAYAPSYWMLIDGSMGIMNNGSLEFNSGGTRTAINQYGVSRNSGSFGSFNFTNSGGMAVGVNTNDPSTALSVSGTLRIADTGETCDANRSGSIKYTSSTFYTCDGTTGWKPLTTGAISTTTDRITSGTTQAIAYNNTSLSLVTAGTERMVIGTSGIIGIGQQPNSGQALSISGSTTITGNLNLLTATANSVLVGANAGQYTIGNGADNVVALGYGAAQYNRGTQTTAVGNYAGANNFKYSVTTVGYNSGYLNTGDYLTAIGHSAAQNNTGANTTALGYQAAQLNTGADTTAVGNQSAINNTGSGNTAVGSQAMQFKTAGANNAIFGYSAGTGTSGNSSYAANSLFGAYSGTALTTGGSNTLIGYNSGAGLTTGSNNLVIGANLSPFSNTGSNQLNIAGAIFGDTGRALASKIGINVTSPTANLEVSGTVSATRFVGDGSGLTNLAGATGDRIISGTTQAIAYQDSSLSLVTAGTERMVIGTSGRVGIAQQPVTGFSLSVSGSTYIRGGLDLQTPGLISNTFVGTYAGTNASNGTYTYLSTGMGVGALQNASGSTITGVGYQAGQNNNAIYLTAIGGLAGQYNGQPNLSAIGYGAGQYNAGINSTMLGMNAGNSNSGSHLTAMGFLAGLGNTGANNTLVGAYAGQTATGSNVTAIGYQAGQNNSGTQVIAIGSFAGQYNTAFNLSAIGYMAGQNNTGSELTVFGSNAAVGNSGSGNTAVGSSAMQYKTGGNFNVAMGYNAGLGVSGTANYGGNTLLGAYAGTGLTTGNSNTLVGYNVGAGITTGSNNILLGATISPFSNTGSNQLNIGNSIFGDLGRSLATRIGINVTSPTANLEVSGTVSVTSLFVNGVAVSGGGGASGDRITSGTTSVIANNNGAISFTTAGTERMAINASGNVGIGTAPTSAALTITGRVNIQTAASTSMYIGSGSGSFATGGTNNVGLGPNALGYATSGYSVAVGNSAGQNNTGSYSTLLGASAGTTNTGTNAVAIGSQAGGTNTGNYLTAVGSSAGYSNQAVGTTAVGNLALYTNTTGAANTGVGYTALQYNATGAGNTAVGYAAGLGTSSNNFSANTLIGAYAGTAITTGSSNTIIGYNTGAAITTGSNNLLIGSNLSPVANTGSNQMNIGNAIFGNIGSALGNANLIGINVASPTANLEVSGTVSFTTVAATGFTLTGVSGSAGVSLTGGGASALTGLTDVNVSSPASGTVLTYNSTSGKWEALAASGGLGDRITSGTFVVTANTSGASVSLTTAGTTWGYFSSAASYLPALNASVISSTRVSSTNVSATFIQLQAIAGSAGVSLTGGGADNLGNHTATQDLTMSGFNITGAAVVSASGTIKTTAAVQAGNTDTTCSTTADYGKMRFDSATKRLFLCRP